MMKLTNFIFYTKTIKYNSSFRKFSQQLSNNKVALILSGCGVYDGSEIHEASSCMIHLSKHLADTSLFAPDINQHHIIDHKSGNEMKENRNVLIESARIARGKIESLENLKPECFDALIIPGGFGVAKNLSNFAFKGVEFNINKQLENSVRDFVRLKKPIGVCCIAPVILSKIIPGVEVTLGGETEQNGKWPYTEIVSNLKKLGIKHFEKNSNEIHIDKKNLIVSTPAYMCDKASLHDIFKGIGLMIDAILKMANERK